MDTKTVYTPVRPGLDQGHFDPLSLRLPLLPGL